MRRALVSVLLLAGCPSDDTDSVCETDCPDSELDTDDTDLPAWEVVAEDLGGALLSITGTDVDDVWAVGAQDDDGPVVLRYDGGAWARVATPTGGDLWWGWRPPGTEGELWAVGANGRALHLVDGDWSGGTIAEGGEVLTLFGVWGAAADDAWAVGGNIGASGNAAVMFHWDGEAWSAVELPPDAAAKSALYKVWGSGPDDVWACGVGGALLHFDGETWTDVESGTDRTLLTLSGTGPDAVWAVGGIGTGTIVRFDGEAWVDESPDFAPDFNGVAARGDTVVAVGATGWVWRRGAEGAWLQDPRGRAYPRDLHAVWIDPEGGTWAVGGQIAALPLVDGVLVHAGPTSVPAYTP